jgi:hypothetical protein
MDWLINTPLPANERAGFFVSDEEVKVDFYTDPHMTP